MRSKKLSGPRLGKECRGWNGCSTVGFLRLENSGLREENSSLKKSVFALEALVRDALAVTAGSSADAAAVDGLYRRASELGIKVGL